MWIGGSGTASSIAQTESADIIRLNSSRYFGLYFKWPLTPFHFISLVYILLSKVLTSTQLQQKQDKDDMNMSKTES